MKTKLTWLYLIFYAAPIFAQTQVYKSDFSFFNFENELLYSSLAMSGNTVVFSASDFNLYGISKTNYKTQWEIPAGIKSNAPANIYKDSFFFDTTENGETKTVQYDLTTGRRIRQLRVKSMSSKPHFVDSKVYFTGLEEDGGGVLVAYDSDENQIIWKKFIGHASDLQPVYQRDKILVCVDKGNWYALDYNGKMLDMKTDEYTYNHEGKIFVNKYLFLMHNGKQVTREFLDQQEIYGVYDVETSEHFTFILNKAYLTVFGNKDKPKLKLDLGSINPAEEDKDEQERIRDAIENGNPYVLYENIKLGKVIKVDDKTIWFLHQDHLVHYDFKHKKLLTNVDLQHWLPHQLLLDNHTIWLISKNDGQLYALEFEPDEVLARKQDRDKAIQAQLRCNFPDPKRFEVAKMVEEKLRNNN